MMTSEFKNIDPIITKENFIYDICNELKIEDHMWISIKSPRMVPWGTQQAVVVTPASIYPEDNAMIKIKRVEMP
jgi:hypothetical protein